MLESSIINNKFKFLEYCEDDEKKQANVFSWELMVRQQPDLKINSGEKIITDLD